MSTTVVPKASAAADPASITHYHAHIYYDPAATRDRAARLRERVAATFPDATVGRWHDEIVGPHLRSMYQVAFQTSEFARFVPWLMLNRQGLDVLIHPLTESAGHDLEQYMRGEPDTFDIAIPPRA